MQEQFADKTNDVKDTTQQAAENTVRQAIAEAYGKSPEAENIMLSLLDKTEGLTKPVVAFFGHNRANSVGEATQHYATGAHRIMREKGIENFSIISFCSGDNEDLDQYVGHGVWLTPEERMYSFPSAEELENTTIIKINEPAPEANIGFKVEQMDL